MTAFTLDTSGAVFDLRCAVLITITYLAWRGWRWLNQLNQLNRLTRAQRHAARPWEQLLAEKQREARHG